MHLMGSQRHQYKCQTAYCVVGISCKSINSHKQVHFVERFLHSVGPFDRSFLFQTSHKIRAILLLESNFNYFNKTIFTCWMLASAREKEQIPIESFAKKRSNCINAVMTKIMFCDELRTHHHSKCIRGNNFGDCYNRVAHPPASIALQSFGVPPPAIWVLLLAMQAMRFF
jgi:hypothetical protein